MRKAVWLLCIAACLIAAAPVAVAAENRGSIQVKLEAGDLAVTNGAVTLYQVGIKVEDGYRITEGFAAELSGRRIQTLKILPDGLQNLPEKPGFPCFWMQMEMQSFPNWRKVFTYWCRRREWMAFTLFIRFF